MERELYAEAGDHMLHPAAYTNDGLVPDRALLDADVGHVNECLCSRCGQQTTDTAVDAEEILNPKVVQATRFCRRRCAVAYYMDALNATDRAHLWSAVAMRINAAFDAAEHERDGLMLLTRAVGDDQTEIPSLIELFPHDFGAVQQQQQQAQSWQQQQQAQSWQHGQCTVSYSGAFTPSLAGATSQSATADSSHLWLAAAAAAGGSVDHDAGRGPAGPTCARSMAVDEMCQ